MSNAWKENTGPSRIRSKVSALEIISSIRNGWTLAPLMLDVREQTP